MPVIPLFIIFSVLVYWGLIRPRQIRWGATGEEVARSLPGDEIVKHPSFNATRAVTIQARPENIWPWLLQIGSRRAGWYSLDFIDNAGIASSDQVIPNCNTWMLVILCR